MADVSTTHQVVNRSNMQDLVISKLEFIRLSATSGQISIIVTAETEGGNKGIYGPIDADAVLLADKLLAKKYWAEMLWSMKPYGTIFSTAIDILEEVITSWVCLRSIICSGT